MSNLPDNVTASQVDAQSMSDAQVCNYGRASADHEIVMSCKEELYGVIIRYASMLDKSQSDIKAAFGGIGDIISDMFAPEIKAMGEFL